MLSYKGYVGKVEYDDEAKILHGRVVGIRDVITFQADTTADVEKEFRASVDDYLAFCKELGDSPDKPASGNIPLRVSPALHSKLAMFAEVQDVSLNAWIESTLNDVAARYGVGYVASVRAQAAKGSTGPKGTVKANGRQAEKDSQVKAYA